MSNLVLSTPNSPAPGCYDSFAPRFAAMRRKRANSVNAKAFSEVWQKRIFKEKRKCASQNHLNVETEIPEEFAACSSSNQTFRAPSLEIEGSNIQAPNSPPYGSSNWWCTTPRRDKKSKQRRSGSVSNVSFTDTVGLSLSSGTYYARKIPLNQQTPVSAEKRCLQLLMEELDTPENSKSAKSKRKESFVALDEGQQKYSKPPNRRRSLPAIFSIGKESVASLSLFKRTPSTTCTVENRNENSNVKSYAKTKKGNQTRLHASKTFPNLFPWKRSSSKSNLFRDFTPAEE